MVTSRDKERRLWDLIYGTHEPTPEPEPEIFRLMASPASAPPTEWVTDNSRITLGVGFYVTEPNLQVTNVMFWNGGGAAADRREFAIFQADDHFKLRSGADENAGSAPVNAWHAMPFEQPLALTPNLVYVAAVCHWDGRFCFTPGYFADDVDIPIPGSPLVIAAPSKLSGGQGGYAYDSVMAFPGSGNRANYWVDVSIGRVAGT